MICLMVMPLVSAVNNTTANVTSITNTLNITQNVTQNVTSVNMTIPYHTLPEEFYGNATYSDGTPVLKGSQIVAKDQKGEIIGRFNMTVDGSYGDQYKSSPRLLVYGESSSDIISFYVDSIKSTSKTMKFDSGGIKPVDIVISSTAKSEATTISTPIVTAIPTTISTPVVTAPIVTPVPTPIVTAIPPTTINTPVQTQNSTALIDDATPKFLGVLLISIAICVVGAIITYFVLTKKMKRDDEEEIHL